MKWQTPKTDWQIRYDENGRYAGDYFEAEDYQRIAGNIEYLRQMARELYTLVPLPALPQITTASFAYVIGPKAFKKSEYLKALRRRQKRRFYPGLTGNSL